MKVNAYHFSLALCAAALVATTQAAPARSRDAAATAALVIAPDRGFLGDEEIRDACEAFAHGRPSEIVYVTDERTRDSLNEAMQRLRETGARDVAVLPLFLSPADPKWALAQKLLGELPAASSSAKKGVRAPSVSVGRLFGQSYFAVEVLADRFRAIPDPAGRDVIVVGYGATDAETLRRMEADGQRLAELAAQGFGFKSVRALVWPRSSSQVELVSEAKHAFTAAAGTGERVAVVPFALGSKLDSMMSFNASVRGELPQGAEFFDSDITPHAAVSMWMEREWNRCVPLRAEEVGVVFLAHGADFHWNETMRETVTPLTSRYKIEFAFSMADQPVIERAVRRLEERGVRAITIVRVFGLAASFQSDVENMIGQDAEAALLAAPAAIPSGMASRDHAHHGHQPAPAATAHSHHGHHGHGGDSSAPTPRIRSAALLATVGGMEDHGYFADALLERARALSKDPARETVILVAHGMGDDSTNEHWRHILASLAGQMHANGGARYRAIETGTWREDWPDKRAPEVAAIRGLVENASRDGGTAIVIPARMQGRGDERNLLEGLTYQLGSGFAPHPLFARWIEEKIREGIAALATQQAASH